MTDELTRDESADALPEPEVAVGSEFVDSEPTPVAEDGLLGPVVEERAPADLSWEAHAIALANKAVPPTPPDEPPVLDVLAAEPPEERKKVWNVNEQKWVDAETGA